MLKRRRTFVFCVAAVITAWSLWVWKSGPQIVGRLPRQDVRSIRSLLDGDARGLGSALRQRSRDAVADWVVNRGQLIRLEVQDPNRVLAFFTTSEPPKGRL